MNYKNNYQRKQAVWREKWMRKVEERQKTKASTLKMIIRPKITKKSPKNHKQRRIFSIY